MNKEMRNEKFNKVRELINKLLQVTVENGATESEAISATLKIQKILIKYDMELSEIKGEEPEDITTAECPASNDVWKNSLARVIADNFCVEVYGRGNNIIFYGYKRHCETAKNVFMSLYKYGRKRSAEVFQYYRKLGRNVSGIKNQYYIGFVAGIKDALDAQSRMLMVITPPEVVKEFESFCESINMKDSPATMSYRENSDIYEKGFTDGRSVASRKELVNS